MSKRETFSDDQEVPRSAYRVITVLLLVILLVQVLRWIYDGHGAERVLPAAAILLMSLVNTLQLRGWTRLLIMVVGVSLVALALGISFLR